MGLRRKTCWPPVESEASSLRVPDKSCAVATELLSTRDRFQPRSQSVGVIGQVVDSRRAPPGHLIRGVRPSRALTRSHARVSHPSCSAGERERNRALAKLVAFSAPLMLPASRTRCQHGPQPCALILGVEDESWLATSRFGSSGGWSVGSTPLVTNSHRKEGRRTTSSTASTFHQSTQAHHITITCTFVVA